jgi:hypothetical protein
MNDFFGNTKYMIHYKGQPYKGRNAVKACGAKHVFINMGVNDLNSSQHNTYNHYVRYINEIKSTNPNVDIFILATTPARRTSGLLNNHEINKLNNKMKKLCKSKKDMYYIDINTPLKDSTGSLKSSYASDGYVHLTFPAYKVWTDTMVKYIKNHLKNQKKAKALVKKVGKTLKSSDYTKAKKAVDYLAKSKCKSTLKVKLKQIKKKIKKQQQKKNKKTEAKKTTTETPDNPTTETPSTTEATTSEASSETLVTSSTTEELPTTESNSIEE